MIMRLVGDLSIDKLAVLYCTTRRCIIQFDTLSPALLDSKLRLLFIMPIIVKLRQRGVQAISVDG